MRWKITSLSSERAHDDLVADYWIVCGLDSERLIEVLCIESFIEPAGAARQRAHLEFVRADTYPATPQALKDSITALQGSGQGNILYI